MLTTARQSIIMLTLIVGLLFLVLPTVVGAQTGEDEGANTDDDLVEFNLGAVFDWAAEGSSCRVDPAVLDGVIWSVSSGGDIQGRFYRSNGELSSGLFGQLGDGSRPNHATLPDTDEGVLDGNTEWDRPVGPLQILPTTWQTYRVDGNNDGVLNPQNLWDSAATAANVLCENGAGTGGADEAALRVYTGSDQLAADVMANIKELTSAVTTEVAGSTLTPGAVEPLGADELLIFDGGDGDTPPATLRALSTVSLVDPLVLLSQTDALNGRAGLDPNGVLVVEPYEATLRGSVLRGDWDGDGDLDNGIFDGSMFIKPNGGSVGFGAPGDIPYVGDWDGDGVLTPGIWRLDQESGEATFIMSDGRGHPFGAQIRTEVGDFATPLIGDFDGDGRDSIAIRSTGDDGDVLMFFDSQGRPDVESVDLAARATVIVVAPEQREAFGLQVSTDSSMAAQMSEVSLQPVSLGDPNVDLVRVGGITVATSIADDVAGLLDAAAEDGIELTGWGWRSHERQIELRIAHCADPFETPSNQCTPPTATPGHSRHEFGLAIDFHIDGRVITRDSEVFQWLSDNAADFGLFNLPSEAWHWSVDGR